MSEEEEKKTVQVAVDSLEAMAENIEIIARSMRRLDSIFNRAAVVALLKEHSKVSKANINAVLDALESLDSFIFKEDGDGE